MPVSQTLRCFAVPGARRLASEVESVGEPLALPTTFSGVGLVN